MAAGAGWNVVMPLRGVLRRKKLSISISQRDRIAEILRDLDRVRAEALDAVQAAEALRQAAGRAEGKGACGAA